MSNSKRPFQFFAVTALFALLLLACGIPSSGLSGVGESPNTDTTQPVMVVMVTPTADGASNTAATAPTAVAPVVNIPPSMGDLQETLVALYEKVNPAVVHIFTYQDNLALGTGTGFLVDEEGHVVTNNHVVELGNRYEIAFPNGARTTAELVGTDVDSDLAVLLVGEVPENTHPLPMGNSRDLQVGEFVVAIGNPFGQESSMSLGIVSGLGRSLRSQRVIDGGGQYSLPQVIQTDAPINPGNSGGPLLNLAGEVVGVNAAISTETGTNSGVGFSIPINAVKRVVPAIIADGKYIYPYLGVSVFDGLDLAAQEALNLPQANGAYVTTVVPDGPAGKAGIVGSGGNNLTGGDFIIAIDDQQVNNFSDLISYLVFETEVGQTVDLTILRNGEQVVIPVELGARP